MLINLLLGSLFVFITMSIQVLAVMNNLFTRYQATAADKAPSSDG